jgi:hypothetical protein
VATAATGDNAASHTVSTRVQATSLGDPNVNFHGNSFQTIGDFSLCLNIAKSVSEKILCNVALIIELLRQLVDILAKVVPFAGRNN